MGEEREEDWSSESTGDTVDRMVAQFGNNNYLDTTWQVGGFKKKKFWGGVGGRIRKHLWGDWYKVKFVSTKVILRLEAFRAPLPPIEGFRTPPPPPPNPLSSLKNAPLNMHKRKAYQQS